MLPAVLAIDFHGELSGHQRQDFQRREGGYTAGFERAPGAFELPLVFISLLLLALVSCHNVMSC